MQIDSTFPKVVITPDRNTDSVVDWQDGAIAYREVMDTPFGSEDEKFNVISQIAMNFASLAQNPFLRVLDNIKKIYLFTDGLGQTVQFKGYQSEGHDSAHPDYGNHFNERAGGQKDLNFVVDRMKDFNCKASVHVENESGTIKLYKDNREIASWLPYQKKEDLKKANWAIARDLGRGTQNRLFIPWYPVKETKIYHWNETGGVTTWQLPARWSDVKKVKLYQLTDIGRVFIADLNVKSGKVMINAKANVPYVLYKTKPQPCPEIVWGEGSLVKDPGFDSHSFKYWKK